MPGVFRPYTLVDVLGTLNQENAEAQGEIITSQGYFAQTGEKYTLHDTMATTVQASPAYDAGVWGSFSWG